MGLPNSILTLRKSFASSRTLRWITMRVSAASVKICSAVDSGESDLATIEDIRFCMPGNAVGNAKLLATRSAKLDRGAVGRDGNMGGSRNNSSRSVACSISDSGAVYIV